MKTRLLWSLLAVFNAVAAIGAEDGAERSAMIAVAGVCLVLLKLEERE